LLCPERFWAVDGSFDQGRVQASSLIRRCPGESFGRTRPAVAAVGERLPPSVHLVLAGGQELDEVGVHVEHVVEGQLDFKPLVVNRCDTEHRAHPVRARGRA